MKRRNFGNIYGIAVTFCFLLFTVSVAAPDPDFHIYLCFGQSNMAGAGDIEAQDKTVDNRFQVMYPMVGCSMQGREFGKWYDAIPPLWGCPNGGLGPSDYFGRTMVKELPTEIKIGVIVIGIPGCDIRLFDKTGYQSYDTYNYVPSKYSGSAYAWLMELAELAKKDGVIKGFIMHQGETMPDPLAWPGHVKRVYDSLVADLELPSTTPLLVGELLYTSAGGACGGNNTTIQKIAEDNPVVHAISAEGLTGKDQFHFTAASERTFGARYAETMLELERTTIHRTAKSTTVKPAPPLRFTGNDIRITATGDYRYRIVSCSGTVVKTGFGNGIVTAGVSLIPGIYFVSVENPCGLFTGRFLKK
ncbi:MAG: hypothetical protein JW863_16140 [Chitinispirillaceae bacterium]|nr:hypothetical protein [Chitinispirillaceae bacterium]